MKYLIAIALLVLLVTGCTSLDSTGAKSGHKAQHHHTQAHKTKSAGITEGQRDTVFVSLAKQDIPAVGVMSDDKIVELGKSTCADMKSVSSKPAMYVFATSFANSVKVISSKDSYQWIGLSIAAYCPDKAQYVPGS